MFAVERPRLIGRDASTGKHKAAIRLRPKFSTADTYQLQWSKPPEGLIVFDSVHCSDARGQKKKSTLRSLRLCGEQPGSARVRMPANRFRNSLLISGLVAVVQFSYPVRAAGIHQFHGYVAGMLPPAGAMRVPQEKKFALDFNGSGFSFI
jgi:hypothetical protein